MIPFLPYATDLERKRVPYATYTIIGINLLVFLGLNIFASPRAAISAQMQLGFIPAHSNWYSSLTSMFVHGSGMHLFYNMLFLWLFGAMAEEALGVAAFLTLFIGSQLGANVLHAVIGSAFTPAAMTKPMIGASGAVAGVMGLAAMRFYRTKLRIAYWIVVRAGVLEVAAWIFIALWVGKEAAQGIISVTAGSYSTGVDSVAHWAHLGGFAFGIIGAAVLRLHPEAQREYMIEALREDPLSVSGYDVMRELQDLAKQDPASPAIHHAIAKQYTLERRHEQAGHSYLRAIDNYLRAGDDKGAAEAYEELTCLYPECLFNLRNQLGIATALEQQGRYAMAVHAFQRLADCYPQAAEAEVSLMRAAGICAERLADPLGALGYLERLATEYPDGHWSDFARRQSNKLRRVLGN